MRLKILGRWWRLRFVNKLPTRGPRNPDERVIGECDPPTVKNKEIRVLAKASEKEQLESLIHEMLHAAGWHIDEDFVARFAEDVARSLWRLGYRREDDGKGT